LLKNYKQPKNENKIFVVLAFKDADTYDQLTLKSLVVRVVCMQGSCIGIPDFLAANISSPLSLSTIDASKLIRLSPN